MSKIHYFQRYSQKENVVTNNTLLLFSRLYNYSPIRFNAFINSLFDGEPIINVGLNIFQQSKGLGTSIPDGKVSQESFCLLIETKLTSNFSLQQIQGHAESFCDEQTKILLLIAPSITNGKVPKLKDKGIFIKQTTFEVIINAFNGVLAEYDFEMKDIIEDYADFCGENKLLPTAKYTLRIVPCGITLEDNFAYDMYYAPADRSYREFDFLGIYKNREVQGVGKLRAVVQILIRGMKTELIKGSITSTDKAAINKMVTIVQKKYGHCKLDDEMHFFIVDKFHRTHFRKETSGGIYNHRYIDLREYFSDNAKFDSAEMIAHQLANKTWH